MLNLALVALLSGTLLTGTPDGDGDKDKNPKQDQVTTEEAPLLVTRAAADEATPPDEDAWVGLTYPYGRDALSAPIKLWIEYAFGESEDVWAANGEDLSTIIGADNVPDVIAQRLAVGAQINVINFPSFQLGAGAELNVGKNEVQSGGTTVAESGFGLQGVKVFGLLSGRVVGLHGGAIIDLADAPDVDNTIAVSDQRDAFFFGADFDYPSDRFRLFGGLDYIILQEGDVVVFSESDGVGEGGGGPVTVNVDTGNNILLFTMGAGLRFSVFELGAALLLRSQLVEGFVNESGGHAGTVAPYLKISPPSLPVSIFVQGAVANEYTDYGYAIGGGNDLKPALGFTAGLTVGFN